MIRTIIFDLGGVIMTIDQDEAIQRFQDLGLKEASSLLNPYMQSDLFGDLEAGHITGDEFCLRLGDKIGRKLTWQECQYAWMGYKKEVPQRNLNKLQELRSQGFKVLLLSNTNEFMQQWAQSDFDGHGGDIRDYFDGLYRSYEIKLMKPDEQIFRYLLSREQMSPHECLFIDDGPRNVAVASELGMKTFCAKNGQDWTQAISHYIL